jgi:hypothetical protein
MSAPNYIIVGTAGADIEYGAETIDYADIGTLISGGQDHGARKLEIKDSYGNVVAVVYFDNQDKCTVEVIFDSTATYPEPGDIVSIFGIATCLVDSWKKEWGNEKEVMITINATFYFLLATS